MDCVKILNMKTNFIQQDLQFRRYRYEEPADGEVDCGQYCDYVYELSYSVYDGPTSRFNLFHNPQVHNCELTCLCFNV